MTAMKLDLPYLSPEQDRHGNDRLYVRRNGRRWRIREAVGSPAFLDAYRAALEAIEAPSPELRATLTAAPRGSLGWLGAQYFTSEEFKGLDPVSQRTRRLILEECFREPRKPGSSDKMGVCPMTALSANHVRMLRDRKAPKKGAANNRLKYLSAMFKWACERGHMAGNPCRDVTPLRYASSGFYTWSVEDVRQFERVHPVGTKARLALGLLLFTGVRRGDLVGLGRQHVREGWLRFVPRKTRHRRGEVSQKPILNVLAQLLDESPTGDLTFLMTEYGRPFTAAGFGGWFRKRCDEAGLPQCTAHGLRKAGATMAAEAGATERQLMAMYDWTSPHEATRYTRAASQKRLAGDGMKLIGGAS